MPWNIDASLFTPSLPGIFASDEWTSRMLWLWNCAAIKKRNRIKYKPHGDGIENQPVMGTLFPSHCDLGPSLPLSSIVPWHNVFVCHLLEETCSAAGFTPSPSALPCLNASPWLWFITTLLLSPNPLVMLPVLARPKIEDLSPRSRL